MKIGYFVCCGIEGNLDFYNVFGVSEEDVYNTYEDKINNENLDMIENWIEDISFEEIQKIVEECGMCIPEYCSESIENFIIDWFREIVED